MTSDHSNREPMSGLQPLDRNGDPEDEQHEEEIPFMPDLAPALFVPAKFDITKPPPPLPDDAQRCIKQTLDQIDEHAAVVQNNILYMVRRENERLRKESRRKEAAAAAARATSSSSSLHGNNYSSSNNTNVNTGPQARPASMKRGLTRWQEECLLKGSEGAHESFMAIDPRRPPPIRPSAGGGGPGEVPPGSVGISQLERVTTNEAAEPRPRTHAKKMYLNLLTYGMKNLDGHGDSVGNVKEGKKREVTDQMLARALNRIQAAHADVLGAGTETGTGTGDNGTGAGDGDKMDIDS
ncbi:hypothetical protein F4778DRAFT_720777 [Xylariomycetidae sp. FL2044]|nr:hypothetical protein F4778DRAFT_720777 [Xylariomycetidae sp. FL2044]